MLKTMIVSLLLLFAVEACAELKAGDWARYGFVPARQDAKPSVKEITITVGVREGGMTWWEMAVEKPDKTTFAVRVLSERVPMTSVAGDGVQLHPQHRFGLGEENDVGDGVVLRPPQLADLGKVKRYLLRDGDRPFIEYRDKSTKGPLLPVFDFHAQLIPCPAPESIVVGPFATTGTYLGNGVQMLESGKGRLLEGIGEPTVLILDPMLIVGTGRAFRDIDEGRVTDRNYEFRDFTAEEYDEMVAAGTNYFMGGDSAREAMIRERPAFYTKYPTFEDFPNILYRSNYQGAIMFTDEPAILTNFNDCRHVTDAANLLRLTVAASVAGGSYYSPTVLKAHLQQGGVYFGAWNLRQDDIPAWEAVFAAGWHEMEGGVSGVVHEGRYDIKMFNSVLNGFFGQGFEVTTEEMLRLHYAFLRGAARCFDGDWGTSIYGQADPAISPLAIEMAYDMGARYIWFWTSDHGHHMPYKEQLDLTRRLRAHEKAHPRRPISELLTKPRVAVAFPEGYIGWSEFWPNGIWNNERFGMDRRNQEAATYRAVVSSAFKQGILLARKGTQFDFVVDGDAARKTGYDRIISIHTNGTVENGISPL